MCSLVSEFKQNYMNFLLNDVFASSESILESLPEPDNVIDSSFALIIKNISSLKSEFDKNVASTASDM